MPLYEITADPARIPLHSLHAALERKYQCHAPSLETLAIAFANSLHFAALTTEGHLAAYARLITDKATFAHLTDVFVLDEHRGQRLSKQILEAILAHPELQSIPQFTYYDTESRPFYTHAGFRSQPLPHPVLTLRRSE